MDIALKKAAQELSKREEVIVAYLFGSHVQGKVSKKSDIDIAVLLKEPVFNSLQTKLALHHLLTDIFKEDIDLTLLNKAGSVLKYQVVKNGKLIFEKYAGAANKFKVAIWKEYFDFQPTLEFFFKKKIA